MTDPHRIEDTLDLEASSQDELGRSIALGQASPEQDDFKLPQPHLSMRCGSADRELLKHDFSQDC